nr:(2Fe-2S) ferredoxin domain-containing protein [Phytoactinopolyspora mesophila]
MVGRALGAPTAEQTLADLATRLSHHLDMSVRPALLDHGERSIHSALDECRADGASDVVVLPAQVPRDRYLETWARKAVAHWMEPSATTDMEPGAQDPGEQMRVRFGAGVSEAAEMVAALAAAASGPSRPVTESPDAFRSPNWSEITAHRRHVLVCRGPRCSAHGSAGVAKALATALRSREQDDDAVLVTQTSCLVPCNLGPIVVVHPEDVWYTNLDPDAVQRIVDDHLCEGQVVDELRTARPLRHGNNGPSETPPTASTPEGI